MFNRISGARRPNTLERFPDVLSQDPTNNADPRDYASGSWICVGGRLYKPCGPACSHCPADTGQVEPGVYVVNKMIITVEGNIGAGKSSFAKSLYRAMCKAGRKVVYIPEPVEAWTKFQGVNLLELMYEDRERWAFTFQVNAILHMAKKDGEAVEYSDKGFTVIRERSSFSARTVFTPVISRGMTPQEEFILREVCNSVPVANRPCANCQASDITIYLRTDPKICYERVNGRARPEEVQERVDLQYLNKLHDQYEIQMPKVQLSGCRLLVADGDDFDINDPQSVKVVGHTDIKDIIRQEHTACM